MKKPKKLAKIFLYIANVLIIAGLGFTSAFFYLKWQDTKNTNLSTDQRIAKYENEIKSSYNLPVGEKPTLADVNNADDLKKDEQNKDFFKDTENGDVLLIYTNSKSGVLYRPTGTR